MKTIIVGLMSKQELLILLIALSVEHCFSLIGLLVIAQLVMVKEPVLIVGSVGSGLLRLVYALMDVVVALMILGVIIASHAKHT